MERLVEMRSTRRGRLLIAWEIKILFYAAAIRPRGKVVTMQVKRFDQKTTARFLKKLKAQSAGLPD